MRKYTHLFLLLVSVCVMSILPDLSMAEGRIIAKPMPEKADLENVNIFEKTKLLYSNPSNAPADYTPTILTSQLHNKGIEGSRNMSLQGDKIWNGSSRDFKGLIKLAVANENGSILEVFGEGYEADLESHYNYIFPHIIEGTLPDSYGDGNYRLYLVAQQSGYNDWSKVTQYIEENGTIVQTGIECFINFWIVNNEVTYMSPYEEYYPSLMTTSIEDCSNLSSKVITVSVDKIMNFAETDFSGYISLAIADENGEIISVFGDPLDATSGLPQYNYFINPQYLVGTLPDLGDGLYRLYVVARQEGYAQWAKLQKYVIEGNSITSWGKEYFLTYEISNGNLTFIPEVLVQSISLGNAITLYKGETATLVATVLPENATNKSVTWKSSMSSVVSVDQNGVITAKKKGTAKITATAQDESGVSGSVNVTVKNITATGIELNYTSYTLKKGETVQLEATVTPDNVEDSSVAWSSSNTNVASVSTNGLVTAKGVGSATITAKTKDGTNLTAECSITVSATLVSSISLSKTSVDLEIGENCQLSATVLPETATNKTVIWESSNEDVAMVTSSGLVKALAIGEAIITATAADGSGVSASAQVSVNAVLVSSITLSKTYAELEIGERLTLTATVNPSNATNKEIAWSSENEDVAMVTSSGIVVAMAPGETTVTATALDGSGTSSSATIKVHDILVSNISLNYTSYSLDVNENIQLVATVEPENAANKKVAWKSSDEEVVMVSSSGKVLWMGIGTAVVTATSTDGSNVSASCTFSCINGIATITVDNDSSIRIYTVDGKEVGTLQKGVNIILKADGKTEKVFVE